MTKGKKVVNQQPAPPEGASNEASAFSDIVEWSKSCPKWQRDALRRLCVKEQLDAPDIDALTTICKGIADSAEVLTAAHVRDSKASLATVTLRAIHSVQHVNALAVGETLTFDKTGVTVLYGDNGSGKSGYARILKRACRARSPRGEMILPNIYAATNGRPTAVIEFSVNGQNRSSTWFFEQSADALLSAVSVFDCRTANVHVDQTNDVAYTPAPLQILASLARACQEVKQKLNGEIKALEQQTPAVISKPACKPETRVGKLMAGLDGVKAADVKALAALTDTEKARLATLKTDLAADPARAGSHLQSLKIKLDATISRAERLAVAVADSKLAALRLASQTLASARTAAQAASISLFSKEPLPEIASDAWRVLWEAARKYSETAAYPDQPFPVTSTEARCVLCLQKLTPEAAVRLNRFEAFIKDESKRREAEAQAAYNQALGVLDQAKMTHADRRTAVVLIENDLGNAALAKDTRRSLTSLAWRLRHIGRKHTEEGTAPAVVALPLAELQVLSTDLQTRASALLADSGSEERKKLLVERDELADREWLAGIKDDVLAEIERRKQIAALHVAAKDTSTNRITIKSSEIAEKLVTNALRAQFAKEVDRLGVAGLAIELRQERTAQGVPLFRVCLIKKPNATVGEILSEGEHRCVALAAFMAEMATTDSRSAIVFDDPVSSLDHMHREAVAKRLAEEGQQRQMIVFTHDIAFLFLLYENCREKGTHIAFRSINRGTEFAGFCDPNPPPNAQPVGKVIDGMKRYLNDRKVHYERGKQEEWYLTVKSLQEQLRTTWERAVEDALSPVIKRLANKVDTKGLPKLTVLTMDDCKVMRQAYGRCSALLHSTSEAINKPLPNPVVVEGEITALGKWVENIQQRQDKVEEDN